MSSVRRTPLSFGEPAPWFRATAVGRPTPFQFDSIGGRPLLMLFFGTAGHPECAAALARVQAKADWFDDERAAFFGVTVDPADPATGRIQPRIPGIRFFFDEDHRISRLFGAEPDDAPGRYQGHWLLLDRTLRAVGQFPLPDGDAALAAFERLMAETPNPDWAPVLEMPNVFEPELCKYLIQLHQEHGGSETGFMREIDGVTTLVADRSQKIRRDHLVTDEKMIRQLHLRLKVRLMPMIQRVFQFEVTHVERALIGCYEAEAGGHFRAHRDNTTKGTAHRRFAVTINLNAEDYEGGDLVFPEFGPRTYRAPTGGAIVFSCSLLHQVLPVTSGRRFAFLPFLYDDEGARIMKQNAGSVRTGDPPAENARTA